MLLARGSQVLLLCQHYEKIGSGTLSSTIISG
jgi:hypothetical protein